MNQPRAQSSPLRWLAKPFLLLRFLLFFAWEVVLSNVQVARAVVSAKPAGREPRIVEYPLRGLGPLEVLILSHCITLTPGTTTIGVDPRLRSLTLHLLDGTDPEGSLRRIRTHLEAPLLAWLR